MTPEDREMVKEILALTKDDHSFPHIFKQIMTISYCLFVAVIIACCLIVLVEKFSEVKGRKGS